ncbi:MAG TPA: DUF1800 domain-containing protein [Rhizomicrobium sp.]|nr:DUF1800 domain-containing protein [Rhizomicrobium sp.]
MSLEGVLAVNRFGLGARPGEVEQASDNPKTWLTAQLGPAQQPVQADGTPFKSGAALVADLTAFRRERRDARKANDAQAAMAFNKQQRQVLLDEMSARFDLGFSTTRPFAERLVWFWTNHFTISTQGAGTASFAGAYEREAIRPFIAGKFEDMLLAVATHPAMLVYLNNAQSIGPDSLAGVVSRRGLNENFGRELMELYSLGVNGGYTQADVIALAKLLTGWSIDTGQPEGGGRIFRIAQFGRISDGDLRRDTGVSSGFRYFENRHEPGRVSLRGKTYPDGYAGGRAAIHDLAHDPATARFIAGKFAVHFISDTPPPESVTRLENIFRDTGGDLKALAVAVVEDPAAWTQGPGKMRPPVDYITATYRLLNLPQAQNAQRQTQGAMQACRLMGQFPMAAPSPKGWSDQSQDWSGPDAVLSRIAFARQLASRLPQNFAVGQVTQLADRALGSRLSAATRGVIAAAANAGEAMALLLSSSEFQRR